MNSNIRTIYLYIVCFITLIVMCSAIVGFASSITEYFYPTDNSYYNETMKTSNYVANNDYDYDYKENAEDMPLRESQEQKFAKVRNNIKIRQIKIAATNAVVILITGLLYLYHNKKVKEEQLEMEGKVCQ